MPLDNLTSPNIHLAFESFLLDCQARSLRPRTVEFYEYQLSKWFEFLSVESLDQITPTDIRKYFVHLQSRGLSDGSVHAAARSIRAFLNFCVADEWLDRSPMERVRMPKRDNRILPSFTADEIQELITHAKNQRDRAIVCCLLDTGCRAGELLQWHVEDVNLRAGTVKVMGKNRRERLVYLGNRSRRELLKMYALYPAKPTEPVWRSDRTGKGLTYAGLRSILRRLGEATGIEHCSAHTFRRTFAIESLRNGMNIYVLQRLMDHSDLTVLRRYLDLVERDLKEAAQRHGVVDNLT